MAEVKPDPGAGVGKSGVVTPWENGNRGGDSSWAGRGLGPSKPDWQNGNRKNSAGTGREWDKPYEKKNSNDGTDQNQSYGTPNG